MNQREKLLIGVVAAVVVLFLGNFFYGSYRKSLAKLDAELAKAQQDFQQAELKLNAARQADGKLARWRQQSLPSGNPTRAYQLYSNWLIDLLQKVNLHVDRTDRLTTPALPASIGNVGVGVNTSGSLTQLVEFLYEFYSAPQLNQITRLEMTPDGDKPTSGAGKLKMRIQVEALILPDTKNNTFPAAGKFNRFPRADVAEYQTTIERRNIFAAYNQPIKPPPPPPPPPTLNDLRFARFTGATLGNRGLIAWIYLMNTGDLLMVSEGEAVKVGAWNGKVVSVEPRAVILEQDGKQTRVDMGDLIKDGKAVPVVPEKSAAGEPNAANI